MCLQQKRTANNLLKKIFTYGYYGCHYSRSSYLRNRNKLFPMIRISDHCSATFVGLEIDLNKDIKPQVDYILEKLKNVAKNRPTNKLSRQKIVTKNKTINYHY